MPKVELIYDMDCPNVEQARTALIKAFGLAGVKPSWIEWNRADVGSPDYVRMYGSPTLLIDGNDVAGESNTDPMSCCRLYSDGQGGYQGAPTVESIAEQLKLTQTHHIPIAGKTAGAGILTMLPSIGLAAMPKLFCPACWPAYTGILSAMGINFVNYTPYLLPLTATFLIVTLATLAYKAKQRRGYGPFYVGVGSAAIILFGKFAFESDIAMYAGIVALLSSTIWNSWPSPKGVNPSCPNCIEGETS